ncbi:HU family DNA-binding protein [Riemerella anatipestifer]|uniref:HU family DNA-binding protein n=1 Tax=Riemerella anatipestifer TaxID=34085 RepID=UPI00129DAC06|nr:HU family DNA-binding protein [Riemerella anatipestifer]MDY3337930.1 HU family DNA-binding protein [Riemerella anatipestifer]MDY3362820.1 HU family DNA-binding protein [Riemerella anatipestifer]MRM84036.1 DNA-binding protein [Riemerella anatipestifer]
MPVKFTVIQKGNPSKPEEPKKYYASAKASGEVTFRSLSKEIAQGSTTVSDTDVLAVLNDLTKVLSKHLSDGKIVRFGDFGSFQISISSEGAETEDKVTAAKIKSNKILFRPGIELREMLAVAKYEKAAKGE